MATTPISLQGWDTANVTTFDVINTSIVNQGKTPANFGFTSGDPNSQPSIDGTWNAWNLVPGGSGQTLAMACPIMRGTATFANPMNTMPGFASGTRGASLTIDASGLVVTNAASSGPAQSVLCAVGRSSGKYYFEVTLGQSSTGTAIIGLAPSGAAGQAFATTTAGAYGYQSNGQAISAGVPVAFPGASSGGAAKWSPGDTVGVAVDLDVGKIWFRGPDGSWQGAAGADPVAGVNPAFTFTPNANTPMFPAVALGAGVALTANFGQMVLKKPPPGGFTIIGSVFTNAALDGCVVNVQISLAKFQLAGGKTRLMPDPTNTPTNPAVVVTTLVPPTGSNLTQQQINQLTLTLDNVLNNDLVSFTNIFHTLDFNSALAKGKLAWLSPTATEYAVADAASAPTAATSSFALLSMTEKRDDSTLGIKISSAILDGLPIGANSVFALSAERFAAKILLDVAVNTLVGSKEADFSFDTTGLVISNNKELTWRETHLLDGSTVFPTVPMGGFKITVVGNYLELEFTGVHFDVPGWKFPGHKIATLQFKQHIFLKLIRGTDNAGKTFNYLIPRNVDPNSGNAQAIADDLPTIIDPVVVLSYDATAIAFQSAVLVATIAISVLSFALVGFTAGAWVVRGKLLAQSVDAAANAANNGGVGMVQMGNNVYEGTDAVMNAAARTNALTAAANAAAAKAGTALLISKFLTGASIVSTLTGASLWATWGTSVAGWYADGDGDKLPSDLAVEKFLAETFQAYDWTGTSNNWAAVDARLAGSLLIYGKLS